MHKGSQRRDFIGYRLIFSRKGKEMTPEEEVLATAREIIESFNNEGPEIALELQDPISAFGADGGLLQKPNDFVTNSNSWEKPDKFNMSHWKHPEVYVNGDMAFMTGYLIGFWERNGERTNYKWRDTLVFEKRNGNWVRIHFHTSALDHRGI